MSGPREILGRGILNWGQMSTEERLAGRGTRRGDLRVSVGHRLEAAIISDHTLGALKQLSFILSWFRRPEI